MDLYFVRKDNGTGFEMSSPQKMIGLTFVSAGVSPFHGKIYLTYVDYRYII